ncbi:beta-galactosidase [Pedobacter westerhofensis]|uniref:hypothetical protein n=1 Tax=Pedobacter westerhofensis TaxID=425512 RepID=UPI001FE6EF8E|nr:hypothetical protein [Pedobacter westerhofensis]
MPKGTVLPSVPAAKPTIAIPSIDFKMGTRMADILPAAVKNANPLTFEDLHQDYGFVWYRTFLDGGKTGVLKLKDLRDYAIIMINGQPAGVLDRRLNQDSISIALPAGKVKLDILVENLGRINFGKYLLENKKGITEKVLFAGSEVKNWEMYGLPMSTVAALPFKSNFKSDHTPVIKKAVFTLDKVGDTYLDMSKWGKGSVWLNGHNLGRYWEVGPQQTLYIPAEWLKKGINELVVAELLKTEENTLQSLQKPVLSVVKK